MFFSYINHYYSSQWNPVWWKDDTKSSLLLWTNNRRVYKLMLCVYHEVKFIFMKGPNDNTQRRERSRFESWWRGSSCWGFFQVDIFTLSWLSKHHQGTHKCLRDLLILFTKFQPKFLDVVISRILSLLWSILQSPKSSSPWAASVTLSLWQACSSHRPNSTGASPPPPLSLPQVYRFFSANKNQRFRVYPPQNVSFKIPSTPLFQTKF